MTASSGAKTRAYKIREIKKVHIEKIEQVNGCIMEELPHRTGLRMKSVFLSNSLISAVKVQLSTVLNHH